MVDRLSQPSPPRRRWGLWLLVALLVVLAAGMGILWWYASELYDADDVRPGHQAAATATTRAGVLAVFAATIAAIGATAALAETRRANVAAHSRELLAHEREREAQVTDRYTRAVDQIGNDKLDIRLGGIYALERIAQDSDRDLPIIVEVLCAFVRGHGGRPDSDNPNSVYEHRPPTDTQAAMTVINRLKELDGDGVRIDLRYAHLVRMQLEQMNLSNALLWGADLRGAVLVGTRLTGASLDNADLSYAALVGWTSRDSSDRRNLHVLPAEDRKYIHAELSGADLYGAKLDRTQLQGVDLSQVKGLTQQQIDDAEGSESTQLPTVSPGQPAGYLHLHSTAQAHEHGPSSD